MTIYSHVNYHLRAPAHHWGMQKVKQRPGAKKGVPKPLKRRLDDGFADRMKKAIANRTPHPTAAELAKAAHCSRQSIHNYLSGEKKIIEVFVLFDLARALNVSPDWLLLGGPEGAQSNSVTPDQRMALQIVSLLETPEARQDWFDEGFRLHRRLTGSPAQKQN